MTDTTPKEETPRCPKCGGDMWINPDGLGWGGRGAGSMRLECRRYPKDCEIAALRSEVEALRKRNEELEQKIQNGDRARTQLNEVAVAFHHKYAFPPKMAPSCIVCGRTVFGAIPEPNGPAIVHAELPGVVVCYECRDARARLSAAESRAQEAETKLRAAEDVVVVLSEALQNTHDALDEPGFVRCERCGWQESTADLDVMSLYIKPTLSNTSSLAAQRKREIQRETLEKAWERFLIMNTKREICTTDFDGKEAKLARACAAILGEKDNQ